MNNTDENQTVSKKANCQKEKNQFFSALTKIIIVNV